jgi:hypothetical protein
MTRARRDRTWDGQRWTAPRYRVIDGHPVPYCLTVQVERGREWRTLDRLSGPARAYVEQYLDTHRPGTRITATERGYVWYGNAAPKGGK